jgi:hypothetical protein
MITVLSLLALAGVIACIGVILYCVGRDRASRGMRVKNGQVYRERVTKTLPDEWLKNFYER